MDEKWKKKMKEAVLKLRSSLKDKLVQLGIKPEGEINVQLFSVQWAKCLLNVHEIYQVVKSWKKLIIAGPDTDRDA